MSGVRRKRGLRLRYPDEEGGWGEIPELPALGAKRGEEPEPGIYLGIQYKISPPYAGCCRGKPLCFARRVTAQDRKGRDLVL